MKTFLLSIILSLQIFGLDYKVTNVAYDDTLSVRIHAGSNYQKVGELAYNAKGIKVLKCKNITAKSRWCKISHKESSHILLGWVNARYLVQSHKAEQMTLEGSTLKEDLTQKLIYQSLASSLYVSPSIRSQVVSKLEKSTKLIVKYCKESEGKWCYVETYDKDFEGDFNGWVQAKMLKPYSDATYVNLLTNPPVTVYAAPNQQSAVLSALKKPNGCYYALKCKTLHNKSWCNVVYAKEDSGEDIKPSDFKQGWIPREHLIAATKFTAMPLDGEDGYCIIRDMLAQLNEK